MKTAVVLLNLGGPLKEEDIKPFLFNFFMDKNIIGAPKFIRYLIAKWIAYSRGKGPALEAYGRLGGKSPLLENTQTQAEALEKLLQERGEKDIKVFIAMRYWHPRASQTVQEVKDWGAERVVLLPLYPQYSTTTVFSSLQEWGGEARKISLDVPVKRICCYPVDRGFIQASADLIRQALGKAPTGTRLLFSAHGLPESVIAKGDSYQYQCEKTAEAIVNELGIDKLDWQMCYQSRVGPMTWIGPSTEEALEKAAHDKVGVIIYPHAFVSEHVETLVEIEMEYREKAEHMGISYFGRVPTVSTHPEFIAGLADLVQDRKEMKRFCPEKFSRCGCAVSYD